MSLITTANFLNLADRVAACWDLLTPVGSKDVAIVTGTLRDLVNKAFTTVVGLADYEQEVDLGGGFYAASTAVHKEAAAKSLLTGVLSALEGHVSQRGRSVATSITDVGTFLSYYNGGAGGARFGAMVTPSFGDLYFQYRNARLPAAGVLCPAINPANGSASGMGTRAVGGAFADGAAVDTTKYSEVNVVAVVTVNYAAGTGAPTVTVTGTDHTGVTMTWTGTFALNNPTAAISTTLSGPVTAWSRQTVGLASAVGVAVGSWLTIEAGTANAETVLVEALAGSNVTATFQKAHSGGAAVTGNTTIALAPGTAGRRCRDVTDITLGITGHTAGTVRVEGVQDRVPV